MRQILIVDKDPAGIGADQTDDHVEGRGLAGAVRPEQADHLAAVDAQREIPVHLARTVAAGQMLGA